MRFDDMITSLGLPDTFQRWRPINEHANAASHPPELSVLQPGRFERIRELIRLEDEPAAVIRAALDELRHSPAAQSLFVAAGRFMRRSDIDVAQLANWPAFPAETGLLGRLFYALLFLEHVEDALTLHQQRGVPRDVSLNTFDDLERWMRDEYDRTGRWGMVQFAWLTLHLTGQVYRLGRLQFQPWRFDATRYADADACPLRHGEPVLNVHIPAMGPLADAECSRSFAAASVFFRERMPERSFRAMICESWLLDQQLTEYLPAQSNIVRFLHRFTTLTLNHADDAQTFERVFGGPVSDIDQAPQDTALRRAIVQHVKAGKRWRMGAGYILND